MIKFDPIHIEMALRALQNGKIIRVTFQGTEQKLMMTEDNILYFPEFFKSDKGSVSPLGLSDLSFAGAISILTTANVFDL